MPTEDALLAADWSQHMDKGRKFDMMARDTKTTAVEIPDFDGNAEERALETGTRSRPNPLRHR